jgi:hypothetical protein
MSGNRTKPAAETTFNTQNLRGQTLLCRCLETWFLTTAPALGRYQRGRGIDPSRRELVGDHPAGARVPGIYTYWRDAGPWRDTAALQALHHQSRFPKAAELMIEAREDVLAFHHFPDQHWRKVWSTNLLERVNEEIKRRTRVVGIFPNDAAITRLVGAVLLEQDEHWHLEGRRMFSAESIAAIPALEELPTQPSLQEAAS